MAAALPASVPLPLLLDSLLASSWTWLALCLATIATLVRAVSAFFLSRHRPQALLPPAPSSDAERISSFVSAVSHPLGKSKIKRRIKSSPALEILHKEPVGLSCSDSGSLSCMHECNGASFALRKAASSSNLLEAHDSFTGAKVSCSPGPSSSGAINRSLDLAAREGFLVDTQEGGYETPTQVFLEDEANSHHFCTSNLFSSCKPPQNSLFDTSYPSSELPASFEKQSGWHSLLQTKLGAPWQNDANGQSQVHAHVLESSILNEGVVKVWSTHEANLFKALMVEEASVGALDVNIGAGWVHIAGRDGGISQWDTSHQACAGSVCSDLHPTSALCWNAEKGVLVAGRDEDGLDLWDCRTPGLIPLLWRRERSVNLLPFSAVHCTGNMVHAKDSTGSFSSCDLRKPQGSCISNVDSAQVLPEVEEEKASFPWEKLSCDDEETWDECDVGCGEALQRGNSFTVKCATLVRSLSAAGR